MSSFDLDFESRSRKGKNPMTLPIRYSRTFLATPNVRRSVVFWFSVLLVVGLLVKRLESGPFAGRSDVAAADPSNSNVMYLGANNGGIWKTTNWSDPSPTWTPITDKP